METKDVILNLRIKHNLSQDELGREIICHASSCLTLGKRRHCA